MSSKTKPLSEVRIHTVRTIFMFNLSSPSCFTQEHVLDCVSGLRPFGKRKPLSTRKLISTRPADCRDICTRVSQYPLLMPSDITPSEPQLKVIGVLNPTFIEIGGSRHLIVRVDERPSTAASSIASVSHGSRTISIARVDTRRKDRIEIVEAQVPDSYIPEKEPILPESARRATAGTGGADLLLSYISHLRIAELSGLKARVSDRPFVFPDDEFSQFGCEDPRATLLEGRPIVTYTGVGRFGVTAWLAQLTDSCRVQNKAMLLGPDHKHSALFPERIRGLYYMLSRPLARSYIRSSGAWLFRSPDLIHWGEASPVLLPRPESWDSVRVGPCTAPVKTSRGWIFFYFGVDSEDSYQVGAVLLDGLDPSRVIARSDMPILSPVLEWERMGRRADTVFPCGAELLTETDSIRLYYGAADTSIGAADLNMSALWSALVRDD
jgi:predicted GH43/DUF377 family glycosyl hydrolase